MHEFSLVEALLDEVERSLAGRRAGRVTEVGVTVGPLSGVEPTLLSFAFECLAGSRLGPACRLVVDWVPLRIQCSDCGTLFAPEWIDCWCPACKSGNTEILEGGDLMLSRITFEEVDGSIPPASPGKVGVDA